MHMKKNNHGALYIGTSNIVVPGNKNSFPEKFRSGTRLHYYSTLFNTVELNSTFYKVPMVRTFEKWTHDVMPEFIFTVKLFNGITHIKNLVFDQSLVNTFLSAAAGMANRKGCLLVQFPGKITFDYFNDVSNLLELITGNSLSAGWRIAIEFRSATWYTGETYELLDEHHCSLVLHDKPGAKNVDLNRQAPFVYLRLHGPAGDYKGSYSDLYLANQCTTIQQWRKRGVDVFVYFNNTMGSAFDNALHLATLAQK